MKVTYCTKILVTLSLIIGLLSQSNSWLCGHSKGNANVDRIVGGWDVGYLKYPWYAALVQDDFVYCGGTLIAPKYVLTAAHCYRDILTKNQSLEKYYDVKLGVYNRCVKEKYQKTFSVEKAYIHEEYQERDPYFDIALLQLKDETNDYMPCCIPKQVMSGESRGKEAFIAGLGNLKYKAPKPPCTMHEARVKIYSDQECRKMLNKAEGGGDQFINGLCAGYLEGGIDACQGDSGGPLMIIGKHGEYILLGLTSFGYECAAKDVLGLYTDVSHYLDWLQKKMKVNPNEGTAIEQPSKNTTTTTTTKATSEAGAVTTIAPPGDFPWNENNTDDNVNVKPITNGNGNGPTIIIYLHKMKKKHHHHLLLKKLRKHRKRVIEKKHRHGRHRQQIAKT